MKLLNKKQQERGNLNPPGAPHSLLGHPFLSEGFTPASLPPSAVFEEPHWDQERRERRDSSINQDPKMFLKQVHQHLKSVLKRKNQSSEGELVNVKQTLQTRQNDLEGAQILRDLAIQKVSQ